MAKMASSLAGLQSQAHPDFIPLTAGFSVFELVHETLDQEDAETLWEIHVLHDSLDVRILRGFLETIALIEYGNIQRAVFENEGNGDSRIRFSSVPVLDRVDVSLSHGSFQIFDAGW